jgi:hypothetical protein
MRMNTTDELLREDFILDRWEGRFSFQKSTLPGL